MKDFKKEANITKRAVVLDVTPEEVIRVLRAAQVSIMIHGHTPRPAVNSLTIEENQQKDMSLETGGKPCTT